MKLKFIYLILIIILFPILFIAEEKNKIEIKDGWFYVNGEKFFIKGMCYFEAHDVEGKCLPNSYEVLDYEFKKIKEAGFNTIRTYLTPKKIQLAKKNGLFIYQDADRLCFSEEYLDQSKQRELKANIDENVGFSKEYDNILYYSIDNEPNIKAVYEQGEQNANALWKMLRDKVKEVQPDALVTISMCPPNAFFDVSMCDIVSLNLYPWNPANNSIGYSSYANWYKRSHAGNKPFIISEYGWTEDLKEFSETMMKLLDQQIKAGATGSFFFTWRAWHKEKIKDSLWWGIIPNEGKANDYKNNPRPIFYDYKKYFEAVAIEPKVEKIYAGKLPFEIYGTDNTGLVTTEIDGKKIELKKQGKYWWFGEYVFGKDFNGEKIVRIEAKDKQGQLLVRKEIKVNLVEEKKILNVKIQRDSKSLFSGNPYEADIIVTDNNGNRVPNQSLVLGINQSAKDPWASLSKKAVTDTNGEYKFIEKNLLSGYFTLMAGIDTEENNIETFADVDVSRVEKNPNNNPNAPGEPLDIGDFPSGWKNAADNGSIIKLSTSKFETQKAIVISYDLGTGKWVVLIHDKFQDLKKYKGIRFSFRDSGVKDKIEFKMEDKDGSTFMTLIKDRSFGDEWKTVVVFFDELTYAWGGDNDLGLTGIKISFAVSKDEQNKQNHGKLELGKLEFLK